MEFGRSGEHLFLESQENVHLNLNLNNSSQSRNCDITGTSQVSALSNDSYGRVLGCTFSLFLKACTVAADVELSGSLFHCGMVFATK